MTMANMGLGTFRANILRTSEVERSRRSIEVTTIGINNKIHDMVMGDRTSREQNYW